MRVLVTGGTGFIGRNVVDQLLQAGVTDLSLIHISEPTRPY